MKFWNSSWSSLWFCWAYYGKNFGAPDCKECGLCWPAKNLEGLIVRFVVVAGPAADEILKLQFVKLVVFAGPAGVKLWNSRL